ncbi:hypothetical protein [Photobacterium atrarenae]|uniref:Uncharacterized protein n=1 Tax=Photobacterium atrarenae TaxID=865757 RepID=A0ABY5GDS3_9GAMM|nr:hypothetical protein [Photobacterium atrarenae]UTV27269.1 hypothetical protein NNL38_13175 [Photobacterium atrarenae]
MKSVNRSTKINFIFSNPSKNPARNLDKSHLSRLFQRPKRTKKSGYRLPKITATRKNKSHPTTAKNQDLKSHLQQYKQELQPNQQNKY